MLILDVKLLPFVLEWQSPPDTNRTTTEDALRSKDVSNLTSCALSARSWWMVYHRKAPPALTPAPALSRKCLCFMLWVQCRPGWDKSWRNVASMPWFILAMSSVFCCMTATTTTCRNRYLHTLNVLWNFVAVSARGAFSPQRFIPWAGP